MGCWCSCAFVWLCSLLLDCNFNARLLCFMQNIVHVGSYLDGCVQRACCYTDRGKKGLEKIEYSQELASSQRAMTEE